MRNKANLKSGSKDSNKTRLDLSAIKRWDEFSMQVAMESYRELGTRERCKVKDCAQPVYNMKSGLCSYHRMEEAQRAFENQLRARKQSKN